MKVVLTIAGSDSGGGAGIQADLKTFEAHGVFGTSAITSITAQNTLGVRGVFDIPAEVVVSQIEAVLDDFQVAAVKIGMLSSRAIITAAAGVLRERAAGLPIVLDPVMVATSGDRLLRDDAVSALVAELTPLALLVTPNVDEAAVLAGHPVRNLDEMSSAARIIAARGARSVLVKGGHLGGGDGVAVDLLLHDGVEHRLESPYIPSNSTHGTGCTLSSAIAAGLALGLDPVEAVRSAKEYVGVAIANAPGLGRGHGPLLHRRSP